MVKMRKLRIGLSLFAALALAVTVGAFQGPYKRALNRAEEAKGAENAHTATVNAAEKQLSAEPAAKAARAGAPSAAGAQGAKTPAGQRRDPFVAPPAPSNPNLPPTILPPGKRGLIISQANLQGLAKTPSGMIAVVTGPSGRTFFLHPNDPVFNGRVVRITDDSVVFEESVIDTRGRKMTHEVVKQLPAEK